MPPRAAADLRHRRDDLLEYCVGLEEGPPVPADPAIDPNGCCPLSEPVATTHAVADHFAEEKIIERGRGGKSLFPVIVCHDFLEAIGIRLKEKLLIVHSNGLLWPIVIMLS
jgi:hypothetical protein